MGDILRGWKEIKSYVRLGRDAIRRNGYPIYKGGRGNIFAFKSELDAFLRSGKTLYEYKKRKP